MKVYVLRHGLTELNKKKIVNGQIDEPLAAEGIEHAKTAVSLIPTTIKYIYTSPLLRASQTAEIINSKLQRPVYSQKQLTEIHMGTLAGKSWKEMKSGVKLKKKHRSIKFNYKPYGGESAADVKKRVIKFLKEISNKHDDYEVLIITHGGIIRLLHLLEHNIPQIDELDHISLLTFDLDKILSNVSSLHLTKF